MLKSYLLCKSKSILNDLIFIQYFYFSIFLNQKELCFLSSTSFSPCLFFLEFSLFISFCLESREFSKQYYVKGTLCLKKSASFQPSCLRRKNSDESWKTALAVVCRLYAQWMKFQKIVWFGFFYKSFQRKMVLFYKRLFLFILIVILESQWVFDVCILESFLN